MLIAAGQMKIDDYLISRCRQIKGTISLFAIPLLAQGKFSQLLKKECQFSSPGRSNEVAVINSTGLAANTISTIIHSFCNEVASQIPI